MNVCLFDIDGTLLASGGAGKAAMEAALAGEFGVAADATSVPFSGRTDRAIVRDLFRLHGIVESPDNFRRLPRRLPASPARLPGPMQRAGAAGHRSTCWSSWPSRTGSPWAADRQRARGRPAQAGPLRAVRTTSRSAASATTTSTATTWPARRWPPSSATWTRPSIRAGLGDRRHAAGRALRPGHRRAVAAVATGWHSLEELAAAEPDLLVADFSDPAPLLSRWG